MPSEQDTEVTQVASQSASEVALESFKEKGEKALEKQQSLSEILKEIKNISESSSDALSRGDAAEFLSDSDKLQKKLREAVTLQGELSSALSEVDQAQNTLATSIIQDWTRASSGGV